jgi:hypothetical protein
MERRRGLLLVALILGLACLAALAVWLWSRARPSPEPPATWSKQGCAEALAQPGRDLPFTSLVHDGTDGWWCNAKFSEPRLYLVRSAADVQQLQGLLHSDRVNRLTAMDYERYWYLIVFDGTKGSLCYGVAVERVRQVGVALVVYAHAWRPGPEWDCGKAFSNPVDVVRIERSEGVPESGALLLCTRAVTPQADWLR